MRNSPKSKVNEINNFMLSVVAWTQVGVKIIKRIISNDKSHYQRLIEPFYKKRIRKEYGLD